MISRIGFDHPFPAWVWLLLFSGAVLLSFLNYSGQSAPRLWRVALGTLRVVTTLLLFVLLSGPRVEEVSIHHIRDTIILLADRSASMMIADTPTQQGRITRDAELKETLNAAWWKELEAKHTVVINGFHDQLVPTSVLDGNVVLSDSVGVATDIGGALEEVLRRTGGRPVGGIVLLSDGRSESIVPRRVIRDLTQRGIPVVVVPLGSATVSTDFEVVDVDFPTRAFVRDKVPIRVTVRARGAAPATPITVSITNESDGAMRDEILIQPHAWVDGAADALVVVSSDDATEQHFVVRIGTGVDDLVVENNSRAITMSFLDEPLRVLYLEGYPRWEYRYIKNMLIREELVESSVMLISADLDFAQEGNTPLARMPQGDDEFHEFDLFIIGDVPGSFLSPTQLDSIQRAVADRGAGLLWIGGERWTPSSWRGTALEKLLPVRSTELRAETGSWSVEPTHAAKRLGLLRISDDGGWPESLTHPATRWARLGWRQLLTQDNLQGAVEVLAESVPIQGGTPTALITLMRFGAGEVIYVASDETWRWRHGIGETLQERFWLQLIRHLARSSMSTRGMIAEIEIDPTPATVGEVCFVRLQLREGKVDQLGAEVIPVTILSPTGERSGLNLARQGSTGLFTGSFTPTKDGKWTIRTDDDRLGAIIEGSVNAERVDEELLNPATNHPLLAELAQATGGAVVAPMNVAVIPTLLPDRSLSNEVVTTHPLWHNAFVLSLMVICLAAEWIGRKVVRLA
ncbi:MAG: hypothetical protein O2800_01310 [Planctomycetota bacterium]|nr:hypothetical protein [Planctomycetota bacterium]